MIRLFFISFGLWFHSSQFVYGAPPPESFALVPLEKHAETDRKLEAWLNAFANPTDYKTMSKAKFAKASTKLPSPAKEWLELMRAETKDHQRLIATYIPWMEQASEQVKHHSLYTYFLDELMTIADTEGHKSTLRQEQLRYGGMSCPQKDLLLDDLGAESEDTTDYAALINRIESFTSTKFRRKALEELLDSLPDPQKIPLKPALAKLASPFSDLKEDHDWLLNDVEKKLRDQNKMKSNGLQNIRSQARSGNCSSAAKNFVNTIHQSHQGKRSPLPLFSDIEEAAERIDRCYRLKGQAARIRFYRSIVSVLSKNYGFTGYAFAYGKQGSIYWGSDQFDQAKTIYRSLLKKAEKRKDKTVIGQTLFTLGRILENEGQFDQALTYYQDFVDQFPHHEDRNLASKAIVMMATHQRQPTVAEAQVQKLIAAENLKGVDERDDSVLSFGLFWAGRLAYESGQFEQAESFWRRGATEFYSTFYGALSHYLVERLQGQTYGLQPSRGASFDYAALTKNFSKEERTTLKRINQLLRLGFKDQAMCELEEISVNRNDSKLRDDHVRLLVKALYHHSAGDWLGSIRLYGILPRTFRHTLAPGFERLLFPKRYGDDIETYSQKLGIDPELVFGIIRQESVFNPRAISPAGARGLMQLMPATARLEAKRLDLNYVSRDERKKLIQKSRNRRQLLDAQTNITIGVHHVQSLLVRFKNPILVLTSYNASPRATQKWQKNFADADNLEFIERIPYKETNSYVKLVLRNYFYYKRWYRDASAPMAILDQILPPSLRNVGQQRAASKDGLPTSIK